MLQGSIVMMTNNTTKIASTETITPQTTETIKSSSSNIFERKVKALGKLMLSFFKASANKTPKTPLADRNIEIVKEAQLNKNIKSLLNF